MFQLTFLNSGMLFLAAATIIPLLIYLFVVKKPNKIVFSSIKFIKASQKKQKNKIKLKNLLLLIIRSLIILLTILAIGRPAVRNDFLHRWSKHYQTGVAIILDTSYSMDYLVDTRTDLERGKDIIQEISTILTERDGVVLFTSDNSWNKLYSGLHYGGIPEHLLGTIEITAVPMSLKDLVQEATIRLRESQIMNREIYIISDAREQELPEESEYPLFLLSTSDLESKNNLSCQNARIEEDFVERKLERKISFEVVNHSNMPQQDVICQLFVNDRTLSEKVVNLQPKQSLSESFTIQINEPGWYTGYVSVRNERLPFDNRSYFSYYHEENIQVAYISDQTSLPLSLVSIIEIYTTSSGNISLINDENLRHERFADYQIVVVDSRKELSSRLRFLLERFAEEKRGVIYLTSQETNPGWNSYFQEAFSVELNNFQANGSRRVSYHNRYHPVMTIFDEEEINSVEVKAFWESRVRAGANVLLQAGNNPLVLENDRQMLWLFDTTNLQNRFLLDPVFPVLAFRTFLYCAYSDIPSYTVGEMVNLPADLIIPPNGEMVSISEGRYLLNQNGIYEIPLSSVENTSESNFIAVNLDYAQSDFERMNPDDYGQLIFLSSNWQDEILRSRYGMELWKTLFVIVLLLMALEMLIVKREEKKNR
jgi:hypothetical protein